MSTTEYTLGTFIIIYYQQNRNINIKNRYRLTAIKGNQEEMINKCYSVIYQKNNSQKWIL